MKHKRKIFLSTIVLIICLTGYVFAQSYTPGSNDDPVVTKTYVDAKSAELKSYIDSKAPSSSGGETSVPVFTPVQVKSGGSLIGSEGTEMILRSGQAKAIEVASNGVSDLTAGKDLKMNEIVGKNHLLLIPRSDGRGITIYGGSDAWVMVKGAYTVK